VFRLKCHICWVLGPIKACCPAMLPDNNAVQLNDGRHLRTCLLGGSITAFAPTYAAKGSRIFVPCGDTAFCFSAKTLRQLTSLRPHGSQVTAVCAGPSTTDCAEPLATGTANGEVHLWDSKTYTCLAKTRFKGEICAIRWPMEKLLVVAARTADKEAVNVWYVNLPSISTPERHQLPVLLASNFGGLDAIQNICVIGDGTTLRVATVTGSKWNRKHRNHDITAVSIDPLFRYIAAGDARGVVSFWWGATQDDRATEHQVAGRWHWHSGPVHTLAHVGPLMLSGGEEGVLCLYRADDDAVNFIPRLGSQIRHVAVPHDGTGACLGMSDNSLAIIDDVNSWVQARWIHGLDLPRMHHTQIPNSIEGLVLRMLPKGIAVSGSGHRVQFMDKQGKIQPAQTLALAKSNTADPCSNIEDRWSLNQMVFSANAAFIMTCESRSTPALKRFDAESARAVVLKWWRREDSGKFAIDNATHNAHSDDVSVCIAHPHTDTFFLSASLDGTFKSWKRIQASNSWHCIASGTWHSQPVLCGCFSSDGSTVALGHKGFIVLWNAETASEIDSIACGDADDKAVQVSCTIACEQFLLLANIKGTDGRDHVKVWDLTSLQMAAHHVTSSAVKDASLFALRIAPPIHGGGVLRILAFRIPNERDIINFHSEIQVWMLSRNKSSGDLAFTLETSAVLPSENHALDAILVDKSRILYWTCQSELLELDLSSSAEPVQHEQASLQEFSDEPPTQRSRIAGAITPASMGAKAGDASVKLLELPLRTTPEQQVGILPHLVAHVVPPHAPSHLLPPPSALWTGILATFCKPAPNAPQDLSVESAAAAVAAVAAAETNGKHSDMSKPPAAGLTATYNALDLPAWASAGKSYIQSEIVDEDWMDQLVQGIQVAGT